MRLRILHKGLLFVLVPVALQIVCILQLYSLIEKSEVLATREATLGRTADLYNELIVEFVTQWSKLLTVSKNELIEPEESSRRIKDILSELDTLLEGEMRTKLEVSGASALKAQQDVLEAYKEEQRGSIFGKLALATRVEGKFKRIMHQAEQFKTDLEMQRAQVDAMRLQEAEARKQIKTQVFIAIVAEILLTIAVVAVFLKNVTSRLSILMRNSQRLPAMQPLEERVSGSDEFADLDQVLHNASDALKSAAEHRASLMQMVAHDLRSPLGSASLALESIIDAPVVIKEAEGVARMRAVKGTLSQLTRFVEDLLTIDKLEAGKLELNQDAVDLKELIQSVSASLQPLAAQKNLNITIDAQSIVLPADPDRLTQVLANLMGNAIKFSPTGGTINVRCRLDNDHALVSIADQGPGIPADKREKLFQKYSQADSKHQRDGFGLGLAISKLIIDGHGGEIGVSNGSGGGSVFWFTLPMLDDGEVDEP